MHPYRSLTPLVFVLSAALLLAFTGYQPPTPAPPETQAGLSLALSHRLQANTHPLTFDLFTPELDSAFLSPDGKTAVLWLALREDSGRLLASEPGLALARLSDGAWQVLLPSDPGWAETLAALPRGMLPLEHSPAPYALASNTVNAGQALTGYYLPYAAGTARWLEGSISHFQSIPELGYPSCTAEFCHYAYDFTDAWHFPLLASKEGTVVASRDSCSDGNSGCTNYIVLRDTSQQTYQIYLHLAHGTIPDQLTAGEAVLRGQYLGDSDDTGYSTSQHVHFMVTDSIWVGGDGYYWGRSIDIRFADVAINNGIPRNCYEVTHFPIYDGATECLGSKSDPRNPANDWFVSGNVGAFPPTGALTRPAPGATVAAGNNPLMDVSAEASDDVSVSAVSLVAKIDGQWVEIGPQVTQPSQPGFYDWDVNLCAAAPLNGQVEVALRIWDHEGNVTSAASPRLIQVDHACPPPTSQLKPAESFDSTAVRLSWDAAEAGAGLGSFELEWRAEPGAWDPANTLNLPAGQRSAWFSGQPGGAYAFRLRALDTNQQAEPWPAGDAPETLVTLPSSCTPDPFEPDDDLSQAGTLVQGELAERNLCGPGNPDWLKLDVGAGGAYLVQARSQSGGAAVTLTLYSSDGVTVLTSGSAAGLGQDAEVFFRPPDAGSYYLKVEPMLANLSGSQAVYGVRALEMKEIFLPVVGH